MKILVSGSHGMVGTQLIKELAQQGHTIVRLVRKKPKEGSSNVYWDPTQGKIEQSKLEGLDAVVHLAGDNIAEGRWTEEKKAKIRDSRVQGTQVLCRALSETANPPGVFISASAVGFYGSQGDQLLSESSNPGQDFLASVCQNWEAASEPLKAKGIRVVHVRFGVILSKQGGALPKLLPPFLMGAGGILGNGKQYMSWITLDDVVGSILHVLNHENLQGPVNVVAPQLVTNRTFTHTLGKVLLRPTLFPVPALALKALLGEMADALLLASQRVEPVRLQETGYQFKYPQLEGALRHALKQK